MAAGPIPVVEVSGTHRQVGQEIGSRVKPQLQRMAAQMREGLPPGVSWEDMLQQGRLCLTHSRAVYPQFVEELEGIAEGAELPFDEVFLGMCEELWEPAMWHSRARGCTDSAARGRATADGATLLAHTNDPGPEAERDLVILKVQAGDESEFLSVSISGLGYSAGFNAASISLTGNEVSSNDVRPGVPRLLIIPRHPARPAVGGGDGIFPSLRRIRPRSIEDVFCLD